MRPESWRKSRALDTSRLDLSPIGLKKGPTFGRGGNSHAICSQARRACTGSAPNRDTYGKTYRADQVPTPNGP